jgi:hypothetical protein
MEALQLLARVGVRKQLCERRIRMVMATNVETGPEPVVLIIADISGYTRYMTANAKTLAHSQTLITELVKAILMEVDLPLRVAKLEGDAVFLFARKGNEEEWIQNRKLIGQKLFKLFESFSAKARELSAAATCTCAACAHVQQLKLKVIAHSGEALFHTVLDFQELAGVDVIIVHRLLKNSIEAAQYLLLTEAAQRDIDLPDQVRLTTRRETCDGIGDIGVGVYFPDGVSNSARVASDVSFAKRFQKSWRLFLKLWFKPLSANAVPPNFRHVVTTGGNSGRIGFALLTAILTPIFLPVGAIFVVVHALKGPKPVLAKIEHEQTHDGHEHKADGSCCEND